jgi:hypothetical protein
MSNHPWCLPCSLRLFLASDPEIVGDTPETVEYRGMLNLVEAAKEHLGLEEGKVGGWSVVWCGPLVVPRMRFWVGQARLLHCQEPFGVGVLLAFLFDMEGNDIAKSLHGEVVSVKGQFGVMDEHQGQEWKPCCWLMSLCC